MRAGKLGEGNGTAVEAFGELFAAFRSAVCHHELARLLRGKMRRAQLDHFTRANEQHALA
jgi:hypothetical protein